MARSKERFGKFKGVTVKTGGRIGANVTILYWKGNQGGWHCDRQECSHERCGERGTSCGSTS